MSSSRSLPAKPFAVKRKRDDGTSKLPPTQPSNRLYVGHIPAHVNEYVLSKHFAAFGRVMKVDYLYHAHGMYKGRPRGYGFVEFERVVDAVAAKELSHKQARAFNGQLIVEYTAESPAHPHKRRNNREQEYTQLSLRKAAATPSTVEKRIEEMEKKLNDMGNGTKAKK